MSGGGRGIHREDTSLKRIKSVQGEEGMSVFWLLVSDGADPKVPGQLRMQIRLVMEIGELYARAGNESS